MRLIDVDELIEYYETWEGEDVRIPVDILLLNLKKCPTAYDPDKVVEQLEEKIEENPYCSLANYRAGLFEAIEIVKSGGAE